MDLPLQPINVFESGRRFEPQVRTFAIALLVISAVCFSRRVSVDFTERKHDLLKENKFQNIDHFTQDDTTQSKELDLTGRIPRAPVIRKLQFVKTFNGSATISQLLR